jgi:hypothetical protein
VNHNNDYSITARSRKRRARLKAEREAAKLIADQAAEAAATVAKEARKTELAATRAAQGLAPVMTSTERSRRTREHQRIAREVAKAEANKPTPIEQIPNLVL